MGDTLAGMITGFFALKMTKRLRQLFIFIVSSETSWQRTICRFADTDQRSTSEVDELFL